jgi:L-asparagine transporter-like permease
MELLTILLSGFTVILMITHLIYLVKTRHEMNEESVKAKKKKQITRLIILCALVGVLYLIVENNSSIIWFLNSVVWGINLFITK